MRSLPLVGLVFVALLPACSGAKPPTRPPLEPIPYPDTDAGRALRVYYETPHPTAAQLNALSTLLNGPDRVKVHAQLLPSLQVIVQQDDSQRALIVAYLLSDDEATFKAVQASLPRLVPALVRGLGAPPATDDEPAAMRNAYPLMDAMLLARLGPDASYAYAREVGRAFNMPAQEKIEPESNECWRRFALAELQAGYGEQALPALLQGLHHADPWVRDCSLNALKEMYALAGARDANGRPGWDDALLRAQAAKARLRATQTEVAKLANDSDDTVRKDTQSLMNLLAGS